MANQEKKTVTVACQNEQCGKEFQCAVSRYNGAKRMGTKLYCSVDCARAIMRQRGQRFLPMRVTAGE